MSLMRLRRAAQLTLPAEIRTALKVKDGDYLEAQIVKGGVLLKPVSVVERKRAWNQIRRAVSEVRDSKPRKSAKADEEAVAREVKRLRRAHA
jgi:bifunctional DNA-binding transcriptional regulator/antitoxin component of YhaV-PrlF toxin-antitoxin module